MGRKLCHRGRSQQGSDIRRRFPGLFALGDRLAELQTAQGVSRDRIWKILFPGKGSLFQGRGILTGLARAGSTSLGSSLRPPLYERALCEQFLLEQYPGLELDGEVSFTLSLGPANTASCDTLMDCCPSFAGARREPGGRSRWRKSTRPDHGVFPSRKAYAHASRVATTSPRATETLARARRSRPRFSSLSQHDHSAPADMGLPRRQPAVHDRRLESRRRTPGAGVSVPSDTVCDGRQEPDRESTKSGSG